MDRKRYLRTLRQLSLTFVHLPTSLLVWLNQWSYEGKNTKSLQLVKMKSCGDYALVYLSLKVRGKSMDDFLTMFSECDHVGNYDKVGDLLEEIIKAQIKLSE